MNLSKKLHQWQEAQLIDSATADKIHAFEKEESKPIALWAFGSLGAIAIVLGIISVIASNWVQTPDWVKLLADLVLCLITGLTLYRVISKGHSSQTNQWFREILVVFYYGFTLASMALIGQTYQLGGSIAKLLLVWTLATLPVVLLGRGKFLTVLWVISTSATYAFNLEALYDFIESFIDSTLWVDVIFASLYVLSPLFFILLSRINWLVKNRPTMADTISRYSWFSLTLAGWLSQYLWYVPFTLSAGETSSVQKFLAICLFATASIIIFIPKLYKERPKGTHLAMRIVLAVIFLICSTAMWHIHSNPSIGALTNITYMFVLAWAALKIHSIKLFNLMTALICLRLLIVYFEVFGSMLETGIGLVGGGVVTLLVVWGWFKKADVLAQYFGLSKTHTPEGEA